MAGMMGSEGTGGWLEQRWSPNLLISTSLPQSEHFTEGNICEILPEAIIYNIKRERRKKEEKKQ